MDRLCVSIFRTDSFIGQVTEVYMRAGSVLNGSGRIPRLHERNFVTSNSYVRFIVFCLLAMGFGGVFPAYAQVGGISASAFHLPDEVDGGDVHHFVHRAMGTEFTLMMYLRDGDVGRDDLAPIASEAFDAIDSLEYQISSWIAASDTSQVNRFGAARPIEVRSDLFELFRFSARIHKETGGAFDITVGPLIELRREALKSGGDPSPEEFGEVLERVGMNKVVLDSDTRTVFFRTAGMRVSFGGIGKGLALDKAVEVLKRFGIESALLSGGDSSMFAIGVPPGKEFWKIGINNPYNAEANLEIVSLRDQALSTSACYHHLAGQTGKPCGIFDPRTGEAVHEMVSVTVIAQSGMETDALSTAFYVMGTEGARDYCARHS